MAECDKCIHADLADWVQDKRTGKAYPVYYCERRKKMCASCNFIYCRHFDDGKEIRERLGFKEDDNGNTTETT